MLLTPRLAPDFARFVSSIGIRTLKADVAEELALPKQTRFLVPIELSAVERYSYQQTYAEALADLGFTEEGDPPAELDRQRMVKKIARYISALAHSVEPRITGCLRFDKPSCTLKSARLEEESLEALSRLSTRSWEREHAAKQTARRLSLKQAPTVSST